MKIHSLLLASLAGIFLSASAQATTLCTLGITTAVTNSIQTPVTGLGAPKQASLRAEFAYTASAATSADVYVEASDDLGATWWDIANFHFTTASAHSYQAVHLTTGVNAGTALTQQSLPANTSINGFLADRLRCVVTSVGTYGAGTQLTVYLTPHY